MRNALRPAGRRRSQAPCWISSRTSCARFWPSWSCWVCSSSSTKWATTWPPAGAACMSMPSPSASAAPSRAGRPARHGMAHRLDSARRLRQAARPERADRGTRGARDPAAGPDLPRQAGHGPLHRRRRRPGREFPAGVAAVRRALRHLWPAGGADRHRRGRRRFRRRGRRAATGRHHPQPGRQPRHPLRAAAALHPAPRRPAGGGGDQPRWPRPDRQRHPRHPPGQRGGTGRHAGRAGRRRAVRAARPVQRRSSPAWRRPGMSARRRWWASARC